MYKIMLADDEGIVIDSVRFIIEKEFGPLCDIQFAKTGRSVIELAESFRPDIAIMDIQMPGINGIDAMKEIRKGNTNVVFIVMSAYDKFDYAKEAIQLGGVLEYITKPMERTRIVSALKKAMEHIDKERAKRSDELKVKEKLETVVPIIESGLIYNILFQEYFVEDIENFKNILSITLQYAYMIAVVCGDTQEGNHMTNAVGSSVKMQQHYQEVRTSLKETFHGIVGTVMANKIAVLVPYESSIIEYSERINLIDKARELVRNLRKRTDISFRIGFGGVREMRDLGESYGMTVSIKDKTAFVDLFGGGANCYIPDFFGNSSINLTCILAGILAVCIYVFLQIKKYLDRKKKNYETESLISVVIKTVLISVVLLLFSFRLAQHKGIPSVLIWVLIVIAIYGYITSNTTVGRHFYAVGGNEKATKLSGINTNKVFFLAYTNMGFLAALAGMLTIARLTSAQPTYGQNYEMDAIGSCFIGGASAYGGIGTVPGVIIGAVLMGVINLGMSLMGVDQNMQKVVKGGVLLAAVIFDVISKRGWKVIVKN